MSAPRSGRRRRARCRGRAAGGVAAGAACDAGGAQGHGLAGRLDHGGQTVHVLELQVLPHRAHVAPQIGGGQYVALACLETLAHLGSGDLPLNRYLVAITVPDGWRAVAPAFFGFLPPGLRQIVPFLVRRRVRASLHHQGLGRHSQDELYDMGWADLGQDGSKIDTPNLDRLAKEGLGNAERKIYRAESAQTRNQQSSGN